MPNFFLLPPLRLVLAFALVGAVRAQTTPASQPSPAAGADRVLSLDTAWRLASAHDPSLRGVALAVVAAEAETAQAGVRPNPTLNLEIENVAGTGSRRGIDGLELTFSVAQVFENAAKRARRLELAQSAVARVALTRETRQAELAGEVQARFVAVALAQRWIELRRDELALAEASAAETQRWVELGRGTAVDAARAELAVRQQTFALRQAERAAVAAQERLAVLWGEAPGQPFRVEADLTPAAVPTWTELLQRLSVTAALQQLASECTERDAAVAFEAVRTRPDLEVMGGARYFNEEGGDAALLLGLQWPWPVSDRNAGNLRAARARRDALDLEIAAAHQRLLDELSEAYRQVYDAQADLDDLARDLLPAATATLNATEDGYARGQFTLLAVLESRTALFAIREAQLDALARYATALARLETLTRPMSANH